jgi:hypothetical protein
MRAKILYQPSEDGAAGGGQGAQGAQGAAGGQQGSAGQSALEPQGGQAATGQQGAAAGQGQQTSAPVGGGQAGSPGTQSPLTADAIALALKKAGVGQQAQPQQPQRQYSQEDFDKAFNVVRPSKDAVSKLRKAFVAAEEDPALIGEAIATLTDMLHGAARQAVTMSGYHLAEIEDKIRGEYAPALAYVAEQREAALRDEFYVTHKDLKQWDPIVRQVVESIKKDGFNGTKAEAFALVEQRTREVIKQLPTGTAAPGGAAGGEGGQAPSHHMATLSSGGQGGGQTGGQAGGKKSPGMSVWD